MSEDQLPVLKIEPEDKKSDIRDKIWNYLADNNLSSFPRPPHRRISNFKDADAAGDSIASLDVFKNARVIRVDPDKPLEQIRFKTLEAGKSLLVPTPRLRNNVFSKIVPPADCGTKLLRGCAARQGVEEFSEPLDIDDKTRVDLVIVGCIAVSSKGWRIGKGGGLSDLEYAMMASLGVVDGTVPVVTMVHDCQVLDFKDDLFGAHDLPVDYIVTPTRVIECTGKLAKPKGIIWSLLKQDKLNHIPVLRRIRYRDWKAGKSVALDGETENPAELSDVILENEDRDEKVRGYRGDFRRRERRGKKPDEDENAGDDDGGRGKERADGAQRDRDNRRFNRRRQFRSYRNRGFNRRTSENDGNNRQDSNERPGKIEENGDEQYDQGRRNNSDGRRDGSGGNRGYGSRGGYWRPGQNRRRPLFDNEGSVYVGSLPRSLRVSQFKVKVRERKVTPLRVLWRGSSGFAFLNFKTQQDAEDALVALEGLQISDRALRLEMAKSGSERAQRPRGARLNDHRNSQGEEEEELAAD